ncbi:hypothetical protein ACFELO_02100 [Oceanicaulis sp. LC35]|uniref:hypothetical protein n=1 Tax=Oceanicaulis sp. LC35 TaxID=3349635 RepID=UPI003F86D155
MIRLSKTRVRNLGRWLSHVPTGTMIDVSSDVVTADTVRKLAGPELPLEEGVTFLPRAMGAVSRFNARGKFNIRRDLPKEQRYTHTIRWTWKERHGRHETVEREETKDIYRLCYPRELIEAPSIELSVMPEADGYRLVSPPIPWKQTDQDDLLHVTNLFLELFGAVLLAPQDVGKKSIPNPKRVNWRMLPSGEYPWEVIRGHVESLTRRRAKRSQDPILERQEYLAQFKPSETFVGQGGFREYIAYVFKDRGLVVLEAIEFGNAVYVFGEDWERLSQLTKREIIHGNYAIERIPHTEGWRGRLGSLLNRSAAA